MRGERYSALSLLRGAITGHRHWGRAWRAAEPGGPYDVIIIGGGGHGLATAYYLAKEHGVRRRWVARVAVVQILPRPAAATRRHSRPRWLQSCPGCGSYSEADSLAALSGQFSPTSADHRPLWVHICINPHVI